ncbi:MAG: phosphate-starvation-inducible PsiE family protein [Desulfobacterales bacterium]|nr:phosphate-starvation-inducible PsiE family protein [Desulfobacterales bacterium]
MLDFLKKFERFIIMSLIIMIVIVVFLATLELGWIIIQDIVSHPVILLEIKELMEILGFFLLILIGIELLETIKAYLIEGVIHVEIVLEVALIAIARKVIILDIAKYDGFKLLSLAALIVAVSIGFFIVKRFTCAIPTAKE